VCALSTVTVSVRLKKRAESSRGKIDGVRRAVHRLRDWLLRGKVCGVAQPRTIRQGGKKNQRRQEGPPPRKLHTESTLILFKGHRIDKTKNRSIYQAAPLSSSRYCTTRKITTVGRQTGSASCLSVGRYGSPRLSRRYLHSTAI